MDSIAVDLPIEHHPRLVLASGYMEGDAPPLHPSAFHVRGSGVQEGIIRGRLSRKGGSSLGLEVFPLEPDGQRLLGAQLDVEAVLGERHGACCRRRCGHAVFGAGGVFAELAAESLVLWPLLKFLPVPLVTSGLWQESRE